MVKLASAREYRMYGPPRCAVRWEYMNAGFYVLGTVLLTSGFAAQFSGEPKSGLVLILIGLGIIMLVNAHDLIAHLAGIDYRLHPLMMEFDLQLGLVEFAVPLLYIIGTILFFFPTLLLFLQEEKGGYESSLKLERLALSMFIAGPVVWVVGSIHNSCQIYERADAHLQILQDAVLIPFLIASLLFLLASIFNTRDHAHHAPSAHRALDLMVGERMIWLAIFGSLLLFVGGLANVVKVFKMQQMNGLERLRGGAHERLLQIRQAHMPSQEEEEERRRRLMYNGAHDQFRDVEQEVVVVQPTTIPTPYKDALIAKP